MCKYQIKIVAFRGFIWKWHGKSFGWAQEDNLNGAVPLCCFFLSFLGNIHSNSEYTMKKKTKMKHVQKEYTFRKIHLSCDGEDCGPLLPQAKMYCWQNYKANRPACLLPRQGCAENEFLTLSAQCTAMYFTASTKERFQVSLVKALFFSLVERVGVCTLSVSYSKAIKYHQTVTTLKSLDELKYC